MFVSTPFHTSPRHAYQMSPSEFTNLPNHLFTRKVQIFQLISVSHQIFNPPASSDVTNICYSFKHAGLYMHICRLLRPIWKKKCVITLDGNSSISNFDCAHILDDLYAMKSFIDAFSMNDVTVYVNQHSMVNAFGTFQGSDNPQNRQHLEQALAEEKKSIAALALFISKYSVVSK